MYIGKSFVLFAVRRGTPDYTKLLVKRWMVGVWKCGVLRKAFGLFSHKCSLLTALSCYNIAVTRVASASRLGLKLPFSGETSNSVEVSEAVLDLHLEKDIFQN
jgi:hypothetical protein